MCGRYEFSDEKDIEEINKILSDINAKYNTSDYKTGEIYPTNNASILALDDNKKPSLKLMKWGFQNWNNKGVIINAKSETADEKKMFSKSLLERRCVIPSTGFYEWKKKESSKSKDKYLFNVQDESMLYMAGIYNIFKSGDFMYEAFVILTTNANDSIKDIHSRMPVILYKNELKDWLLDYKFINAAFCRDTIVLNKSLIS